jgi:outer membrane protein assembly factor BamA
LLRLCKKPLHLCVKTIRKNQQMKKILLFSILLLLFQTAFAQSEYIVISSIQVTGQKKTRTKNILRELDFRVGDTLEVGNLAELVEQNRLLLMSTGLFGNVEISTKKMVANQTVIDVKVEESWYLYPFFNVEVGDRNFNVWWVQQNRALNRLNYVFQVSHRNLTGRRDLLKIYSQLGYERKFQITYDLPYFNENQTLGFRGDIFYAQAKEWGLDTKSDTLSLISNQDSVMIRRFRLTAGLRYQQGVFSKHEAEIRFHRNQISDFAAAYNPDFFLDGNTLQRYFALTYTFTTDYRDFKPYPLKGYFFSATLTKEGFGVFGDINTLYIAPNFAYYQPISKRFSAAINVRGKVSLLRNQLPYFNNRSIGYLPDYMRGYEYYVVDGLDYVMARASVRFQWLDKSFIMKRKNKDKKRNYFPLKIYSTVFHDEAFANNPFYSDGNEFVNRHLWSFGTGLNLVIYNDFLLRIEYTVNHKGEASPYLHFDLPF